MTQSETVPHPIRRFLVRLVEWLGHQNTIDSRWGHRVLRQIFREREFGG